MTTVASAQVLLSASGGAQVLRDLKAVSSGLEKVSSDGSTAGGSLASFGSAVLGGAVVAGAQLAMSAVSTLAGAVGSMAMQAFDATRAYESMSMSFQSLAAREAVAAGEAASVGEAFDGAAGRAQELLAWTQQLAITSPFEQQGVAQAFRTAMAYGFATDEAQRLTQATIDFAAATGAGTFEMDRITRALGQMRARGKVSFQELQQLAEAGVPALQILGDTFNMTGDQLELAFRRGEITAQQAIEAITTSLETDFEGAAARTTNTLGGLVSTLGDVKEIGLRNLFAGVFEAAQPALIAFADIAMNQLVPAMSEIGRQIGTAVAPALAFITNLLTTGDFSALLDMIPPEIMDGIPALMTAFENLGTAIQSGMPAAEDALRNFSATLSTEFGINMPVIMENITKLVQAFADIWTVIGPPVMTVIGALGEVLLAVIGGTLTVITGLVAGFMQGLSGHWDLGFQTMGQSFMAFGDSITLLLGTNMQNVLDIWRNNFEMMGLIVSTLWQNMVTGITTTISTIKATLLSGLKGARDAVTETLEEWASLGRNIVQGLVAGIVSAAGNLYNAIRNVVKSAFEAGQNAAVSNSPSLLFAQLGSDLTMGLAVGVEEPQPQLNRAVADTVTGAAAVGGAALPAPSGAGAATTSQQVTFYVYANSFDDIVREAAARGYAFTAVS